VLWGTTRRGLSTNASLVNPHPNPPPEYRGREHMGSMGCLDGNGLALRAILPPLGD
jgi:hypothetical protein